MKLAKNHLNFAKSIENKSGSALWRQKVSRSYYAAYTASKALRLAVKGDYSQEGSDHQRINQLPNSFEKKALWENVLTQFRSDRNLADYDHLKKSIDLEHTPAKYLSYSENFYKSVEQYLHDEGLI